MQIRKRSFLEKIDPQKKYSVFRLQDAFFAFFRPGKTVFQKSWHGVCYNCGAVFKNCMLFDKKIFFGVKMFCFNRLQMGGRQVFPVNKSGQGFETVCMPRRTLPEMSSECVRPHGFEGLRNDSRIGIPGGLAVVSGFRNHSRLKNRERPDDMEWSLKTCRMILIGPGRH